MAVTTDPNAVFYSYRGVGTNQAVKKFIDLLDEKGIPHRGSESEPIEGALTDFEEKIGAANIIVIFYSQDYFESEHCMNEYANIRKYENDARKAATYYVKCGQYDIDKLVELWGGRKAKLENKQYSLTAIERRTLANGCYIDKTTLYRVQNLDDYFSDKVHYRENNLQPLVDLIADKYRELSSENKSGNQRNTSFPAPSFKFPMNQTKLVARDNFVEKLHDLVTNNTFSNLYGFGGSGKTSLTYLFLDKYRSEYNQVAYVVVNKNIKNDFISQINDTIDIFKSEENDKIDLKKFQEISIDTEKDSNDTDRYKSIIDYLESNYKSEKPNLLIIDINNADDASKFGEDLMNNTLPSNRIYPDGWKFLILTRTNIYKSLATLNLNDKESDNAPFLKELFLKNTGDKYKNFTEEEFDELFKTTFYSPLMAEQLGIFLQDLPKKSLSEIKDILHKDSFKNEKRSGITAQNRGEEENTIIGFLKNLIVFDKLSAGEKILLKHFILWPTDYIPKNVIWQLLSKTFESEKNRFTKLWSIVKRYLTTIEYELDGVCVNQLDRRVISKIWFYILCVLLCGIMIFVKSSNLGPVVLFSCGSAGIYACIEAIRKFSTFRGFLNVFFSALIGAIIGIITHSFTSFPGKIACVASTIILFFSPVIKRIIKSLASKSYINNIDHNFFDGLLYGLLKRGIISESEKQTKCYKLHGLIAQSLREQIEIQNADYYDYIDVVKRMLNYSKEDFSQFAKCIGHCFGVCKIGIDVDTLYNIAIRLHTSSTANYAILLYADLIDNAVAWNLDKFSLAGVYNNYALLQLYLAGDLKSAQTNYENAIKIYEQLPKDNPLYQSNLAICYNNLANLDRLEDYDTAKSNYEKAIAIREQLPKDNPEYQNSLANAYSNLAILQQDHLGDYDSAKSNYENAIKIREQLPKDNPEYQNDEYQNDLASTYYTLADLQNYNLEDYDSAKSNYENAIKIGEQLPKDNPEYQNNLANTYNNLANLQRNHLGDYGSAKSNYEKAIAISKQLPKDNPLYQSNLAIWYNNLANLQKDRLGDCGSAKLNYEKATAIREQLPKDNPEYQNGLASAYNNLAILQKVHFGEYELSKSNYEKAIEIREQLPKDNPEYQNDLARAYNNLANLQKDHLGDYDSAKSNYEKAIAIRGQLPKDNPEYQNDLASAYNNLAILQKDHLGDYNSAKSNYEKAIAIYEHEYQNDLASTYYTLADLQNYNLEDYDSAKSNYEKAIAIYEQLPKDNPEYQNVLAGVYNNLAYTYDKLKEYDKAIESINTAIDIAYQLKETDSKYLIGWLTCRHSWAEIKFNNGKDLNEVKNILAEIKPLAQQCLKDNPDDEWTKTVNDDIADLLSKIGN